MDDDERARRRPRSGLSTTADLASATCRTTIDAPDAADYLIARFEGVTGDDELALIEAVVDRVEPARVGHFLEASGDALDRGWSVPVEMPLGRALAMTPPNAVVERLLGFAERQGLDRCTRWSRSVGAGNPFTELVVPLPGPARAALELGLAAPGELRAPPLPAAVRDALGALAVDGVALSVWLTPAPVRGGGRDRAGPARRDRGRARRRRPGDRRGGGLRRSGRGPAGLRAGRDRRSAAGRLSLRPGARRWRGRRAPGTPSRRPRRGAPCRSAGRCARPGRRRAARCCG